MNDDSLRPIGGALGAPTLALVVAYDGAGFSGFARQPGQPTIQGELEQALSVVLRRPIEVVCAGRTDAGVHALGQVVSFPCAENDIDAGALRRSLNALVRDGIVVREVKWALPGFSARFDAISREYRYRIVAGRVPPLFLRNVAWSTPRTLDIEAMREGSVHLIGEHDFKSFCLTEAAVGRRTHRRMDEIEIVEEEHLGERCIVVRVVGNAFLRSMVRVVVGTLVEVGAGRQEPGWVAGALAACDRGAAGPTAPAKGLTFWRVEYRDGVWL